MITATETEKLSQLICENGHVKRQSEQRPVIFRAGACRQSACNIKKEELTKDNNEYIIEDQKDKINLIGAYYETINSPRYLNNNTRLKEIIDNKVNDFITKYNTAVIENKTYTLFTQENKAWEPKEDISHDKYFRAEHRYLQPQAFMKLDSLGIIQNEQNIPTIYYRSRHKSNKTIDLDHAANIIEHKYSKAIPERDELDFHRLDFKKYWWLDEKSKFIKELMHRKRIIKQ
ncbi:hypothetical protein KPH14_010939 [Odynerus spinipes]|uniref:Uncharacterized protein n=1 Tax=Odynerus spinipes TaxID=1348599 RepID=A0AAD9RWA8_9HYME|nr:hypothetical protein KPH14_010939 [Odynerus spinipes]